MVRKANALNRGDLLVTRAEFMRKSAKACIGRRTEPTGVRAPIVAKKPRNWGGAKGAQEGGYVTDGPKEERPTIVPEAKQAGEIHARWEWVEPTVWTERMLSALERGVRGGKWYSLMDKVYGLPNLLSAFKEVKQRGGGAGVDQQTIKKFESDSMANLMEIRAELASGRYQPRAIKRTWIPKPGSREERPLGIPAVRDRVVQAALRHVLEPIFERDFAEQSYGFRPKRGCKDALRQVNRLLKAGYHWVVDADLKSYFDTIPKEALIKRVEEKVSDGQVKELLRAYLNQEVMEETARWNPEAGTPQGSGISPLLSNIYLDELDQKMAQLGYEMVRYADDFVILSRGKEEAERALEEVKQWTAEAGLTLHPEKTRIVDARQKKAGFDFLGYHFERDLRWPRTKSLKKLKDTLRPKTKRNAGRSLQTIIEDVNRTIRGWFEYFKHSHWTTFRPIDSWIRGRLRSILRKRNRKRGRAKTRRDYQRWPNAYFAEQGLFTLETASVKARQSSTR
jgi:RNA-directed DNA polymerase